MSYYDNKARENYFLTEQKLKDKLFDDYLKSRGVSINKFEHTYPSNNTKSYWDSETKILENLINELK